MVDSRDDNKAKIMELLNCDIVKLTEITFFIFRIIHIDSTSICNLHILKKN